MLTSKHQITPFQVETKLTTFSLFQIRLNPIQINQKNPGFQFQFRFRSMMEIECMRTCMKKLAIWYTPNFKPITSHDELDHILSTHGFYPKPPVNAADSAVVWKEYSFSGVGAFLVDSESPPPQLRLPYPKIDGLHVNTYRTFLESLNYYLQMHNISDLFHIRGMPLHNAHDRSQKWLRMMENDLFFVYRDGTLDLSATCKNANKDHKQVLRIVPWDNIIERIL